MFFSVYSLRSKMMQSAFKVPGGRWGLGVVSLLGIIGSGLTILFGFIPPDNVNVGSPLRYTLMIAFGNLIIIMPSFFLISYRRYKTEKGR